jgi:hypothetical protein
MWHGLLQTTKTVAKHTRGFAKTDKANVAAAAADILLPDYGGMFRTATHFAGGKSFVQGADEKTNVKAVGEWNKSIHELYWLADFWLVVNHLNPFRHSIVKDVIVGGIGALVYHSLRHFLRKACDNLFLHTETSNTERTDPTDKPQYEALYHQSVLEAEMDAVFAKLTNLLLNSFRQRLKATPRKKHMAIMLNVVVPTTLSLLVRVTQNGYSLEKANICTALEGPFRTIIVSLIREFGHDNASWICSFLATLLYAKQRNGVKDAVQFGFHKAGQTIK